jgi:hypothetical protein
LQCRHRHQTQQCIETGNELNQQPQPNADQAAAARHLRSARPDSLGEPRIGREPITFFQPQLITPLHLFRCHLELNTVALQLHQRGRQAG